MATRAGERGFTLIEALVALGIVASVVVGFIGIRTQALVDATHARNWRLAREIAEAKLSELQAGAREVPPESGVTVPLENYEGWSYQVVLGDSAVANLEAEIGAEAAGGDAGSKERLDWQQNRENYRRAESRGLSAAEYQEQQLEDVNQRLAEQAPSATEYEEVAVAVFFPKLDPDFEGQKDALLIKARLSTLAISGLTPEQAMAVAASKGQDQGNAAGPGGVPGGGGSGGGGRATTGEGK
jgi:prepilin-type N-terminal cleavage/methylation domain-containing protein